MCERSVGAYSSPFRARHLSRLRDSDKQRSNIRSDLKCRLEFFQIFRRECLPHIQHRRQTHIRLVAAVQSHRLVITHARKWRLDFASGSFERGGQKTLDHFPHPLRLRIGHFQIDLGKFRLAVGAQIFIAEAADNLEILVESRDHQNLLEQLRRLRQRVETPRLHPAGNQVVARALRAWSAS